MRDPRSESVSLSADQPISQFFYTVKTKHPADASLPINSVLGQIKPRTLSQPISRHYQKKKVVGLERGPLSLVSTIEELLDRKVAAPV
jgi:hypothetical protein